MKSISIAGTQAPAIIQGCMRIDAMSVNELEELIHQDLKLGINFLTMRISMEKESVRSCLVRY